jgi:hypothetical protein
MKNLHTEKLFDRLLVQSMEDALSNLPPWQETETSHKAEDVLSSLSKEQNDCLRSYLNELAEQEAAEKQALYLQGILDGIALAGIVQLEQHIAYGRWKKFRK